MGEEGRVKVNNQELQAEVARLNAENAVLKASAVSKISFKVSEPRAAGTNGPADKGSAGGAISVYGLGRFPVTLWKSQMVTFISLVPQIQAFMQTNADKLTDKPK